VEEVAGSKASELVSKIERLSLRHAGQIVSAAQLAVHTKAESLREDLDALLHFKPPE
jgi:hypothetical protein